MFNPPRGGTFPLAAQTFKAMNYREPLTKNEIREHAAHYENSNPAVYCGTYAKYNNGSLYGMWIDLSTFENYHDFMEFCNRLHANEMEPELMFQDYEHYPEQWYCEGCMGEETFNKIKEYAGLGELQREAYEAIAMNECRNKIVAESFLEKLRPF